MKAALGEWENFLHDERPMPIMLKVGLAHAQFETIHPFLDGNGRVGRLLVTFLLCERNVLIRPLLYLSHYFKLNRLEYYDRLQAVREKGDWEGWLKFFLRGVATVADEAATTARRIVALREEQREQIRTSFGRTTPDALQLHEQLFQHPFVTITLVQQMTGKEFPAASRLVKQMVQLEILKQVSGKARNRVFLHDRYFRMFDDSEVEAQDVASDLVEETLVRESPL
jgi:Fic family protein